jgi:phosphoglycolate phosphatase
MPSEPPSAVLFDLDGVLVDSRAAIAHCINHALANHGHPQQPENELLRFIGPPLAVAFAELTSQPVESAAVAACVSAYRDVYADVSLRDTRVFAGIPDALAELGARHRLAVATSKAAAFAEPILDALGLRGPFQVVAGPTLGALAEPKTATIGRALRELGAATAIMVGDRSFDVLGAQDHGLLTVGVTWGIGSADELAAAGADITVDTPAELRAAVAALTRRAAPFGRGASS